MIKPKRLKKGDKVAVVSLSTGLLGEENLIHKFHIAQERMSSEFGVELVAMPNALKGIQYLYEHPEARAKDLMDAFLDDSIQGIFCAIGGNDTIRLLPYIDFEIIKSHPKVFMGYSDTTSNHFMMHKAGLISFYGPSVMCEIAEYGDHIPDYVKNAMENILFEDGNGYEIASSEFWSKDFVPWGEENIHITKKMEKETHGYEVLQGSGVVTGEVIGGCIDVFPMVCGTEIWPNKEEFAGKILLAETSDEKMSPDYLLYYLRNLGVQGIFDEIQGIIVGKPYMGEYYEEYKEVYKKVLKEFNHSDLPVLYNINIGHAYFTGIMPLGSKVTVDYNNKTITLAESPTCE